MIILGFGANDTLGSVTTVQALQRTLQALGKTVHTAGNVDGATMAALFEIIRDHITRIPLLPSLIRSAFDVLKNLNGAIERFTFGKFGIVSAIRNQETVISVLEAGGAAINVNVTSTVDAIRAAIDKFKKLIDSNATEINTALKVLLAVSTSPSTVPGSTPPSTVPGWRKGPKAGALWVPDVSAAGYNRIAPVAPSTPAAVDTTSPTPATADTTSPTGTIHAFDPKLKAYRVARIIGMSGLVPTHIEVGMSAQAPTGSNEVTLPIYFRMIGRQPWFKTWWGMGAIGVGALGAVAGVISLIRNKDISKRTSVNGIAGLGTQKYDRPLASKGFTSYR